MAINTINAINNGGHQGDRLRASSARQALALLCAASALLWLVPAAIQAQETPLNLRPQWREGQTSRYEVFSQRVQRQSMTAGEHHREHELIIESTGEMTWQVQQVRGDGSATCRMSFDWLRMEMRGEAMEQASDSRDGSGPLGELLDAMTGTPIEVRVAPDGSIESVSGVEAIRRALPPEATAAQDIEFIEYASKLATLVGAPAAADSGARWDTQHRWRHELGFVHERINWRHEGTEHIAQIPVATIVGEGRLELEVDEAQLPDNGPAIDMRLREGSVRAQVMFDLQRAEAVGRNRIQHMIVDMTIHVPQQTIRQQIEQTVQSQVLRIAEQ